MIAVCPRMKDKNRLEETGGVDAKQLRPDNEQNGKNFREWAASKHDGGTINEGFGSLNSPASRERGEALDSCLVASKGRRTSERCFPCRRA